MRLIIECVEEINYDKKTLLRHFLYVMYNALFVYTSTTLFSNSVYLATAVYSSGKHFGVVGTIVSPAYTVPTIRQKRFCHTEKNGRRSDSPPDKNARYGGQK